MPNRYKAFSYQWVRRSWPLLLSLAVHTSAVGAPLILYALNSINSAELLPKGELEVGNGGSLSWIEIQPAPSKPLLNTGEVPIVAKKKVQPLPKIQEVPAEDEAGPSTPGTLDAMALGSPHGIGSAALKYHDELYLLFESRKSYPQAARRLNQQGQVLISLRVWANGRIDDQRVIKASPYHRLNEAALGLVQQVEKFKPLPPESGPYAYFQLPIEYSIN